jgi:hypothetical protein
MGAMREKRLIFVPTIRYFILNSNIIIIIIHIKIQNCNFANNVWFYSAVSNGSCASSQRPSCATVKCSAGFVCILQEVQCFTTPCYPQPVCVPEEEGSYSAASNCYSRNSPRFLELGYTLPRSNWLTTKLSPKSDESNSHPHILFIVDSFSHYTLTLYVSQVILPFRFTDSNSVHIHGSSHACYMSRPSQPLWFDPVNNIYSSWISDR